MRWPGSGAARRRGRGTGRARVPARARSERGASLVEAAVVTPLLVLMLFGIIEGSLFMKDRLAVANAARAAARTGSVEGSRALADFEILARVQRSARSWGKVDKVVVFKAASATATVPPACRTATRGITDVCNVYGPNDFTRNRQAWSAPGYRNDDFWPATSRSTNATGADFVGVWVSGRHESVTGLVFDGRRIADEAVMRLEPAG